MGEGEFRRRCVLLALSLAIAAGLAMQASLARAVVVCCLCADFSCNDTVTGTCATCGAFCTSHGGALHIGNTSCASGCTDAVAVCPSNTPTNTPTATPTSTPTATPTNTPTATPTNTPSTTPTNTPTTTPTVTPTNTGIPQGGACSTPAECATGFCVDDVCCNSACTSGRCDLPGQRGTCSGLAPVPALAPRALVVVAALLIGIGVFTLRRRAIKR